MTDIYERLAELGIVLPKPQPGKGIYSIFADMGGGLIYSSGTCPDRDEKPYSGKVGAEYTVEQGQEAARDCVLNMLARLKVYLGDLNRVDRFVKILGFIASDPDFYNQTAVLNGASAMIRDIFGEPAGLPARSAIGVAVLPRNVPVEIEFIIKIK